MTGLSKSPLATSRSMHTRSWRSWTRRASLLTATVWTLASVFGGCSDDSTSAQDAAVMQDAQNNDATHQKDATRQDATVEDAVASDGTTDGSADGTVACRPEQTNLPYGNHEAGQDCLNCHASMSGNLHFTVAGTLYNDAAGSNPLPGATVTLIDDGGQILDIVSASNGNFYTATTVQFPLQVWVSKCPQIAPMQAAVQAGQGCNSCHGPNNRIFLP